MKKKSYLILFLLFIPAFLFAEWNSNPAQNFAVCDLTGSQVIPKIATSSTGDTFISWFSNESGNYDVRLQRLSVRGAELWTHNGILISNHPSMSWLTDWDMTVDQSNHAILTFQDIRNGGNNNIYAYRISPEGDFIWGADGLELSNSTAFDVSPKVTVTNAGNAVIAWQSNDVIIMQKISPEGNLLWGDNGITLSCDNTYSWPQLLPVGTDDIIMKFFEDSGVYPMMTRHVLAQKFGANGTAVWSEDTVISNAGGISAWTQIFPFINDGNDGFFIAWHDDRDNNMLADIFIQHVDSDGNTLWTANGVEVSTMPNRNHFYPQLVYPLNRGDVYVFWNEMDSDQNLRGIYGQKISEAGERLWTNYGKVFIEICSTDYYPFAARSSDTDAVVFYDEYLDALNSNIKAMRIAPDGSYVWAEQHIMLSSVSSEKMHFDVNNYANNQWIVVWEDLRNDSGDIFGQNIQLSGELGPVSIGIDEFDSNPYEPVVLLGNYPNPFNPILTSATRICFNLHNSANVAINVYNIKGQLVRCIYNDYAEFDENNPKPKVAYWDGRDENGKIMATGIYFYRMKVDVKDREIKKLILMR